MHKQKLSIVTYHCCGFHFIHIAKPHFLTIIKWTCIMFIYVNFIIVKKSDFAIGFVILAIYFQLKMKFVLLYLM